MRGGEGQRSVGRRRLSQLEGPRGPFPPRLATGTATCPPRAETGAREGRRRAPTDGRQSRPGEPVLKTPAGAGAEDAAMSLAVHQARACARLQEYIGCQAPSRSSPSARDRVKRLADVRRGTSLEHQREREGERAKRRRRRRRRRRRSGDAMRTHGDGTPWAAQCSSGSRPAGERAALRAESAQAAAAPRSSGSSPSPPAPRDLRGGQGAPRAVKKPRRGGFSPSSASGGPHRASGPSTARLRRSSGSP
ncbi:unnamed protein product, partial [Prorocentrum cordatum]